MTGEPDGANDGGEADGDGNDVTARYEETERERRLVLRRGDTVAVTVAAPREGYGMLLVRRDGEEVERYYGLEMALDHAAELLGVHPTAVPVPDEARDMGM